jgi:hypothetical protein
MVFRTLPVKSMGSTIQTKRSGALLAKSKDKAPAQRAATHVSVDHERDAAKHFLFGDVTPTGQYLPDLLQ